MSLENPASRTGASTAVESGKVICLRWSDSVSNRSRDMDVLVVVDVKVLPSSTDT